METTQGIIFDIKKFAIHDGPGIRTTVFFKGCPLDCWWCHNPESRSPEIELVTLRTPPTRQETIGRRVTVAEVMEEIQKDAIFYDESGGGVTLSGGEPLTQPEFASALLQACRTSGIPTTVDTSGHAPWQVFERILDNVDLFLYDLKLMADADHVEYTGVSNSLILGNLRALARCEAAVQIRVPLIPGATDTRANLDAIVEFLEPLERFRQISLLPYNKLGEDKCRRFDLASRIGNPPRQTDDQLAERRAWFESRGFDVTIGG